MIWGLNETEIFEYGFSFDSQLIGKTKIKICEEYHCELVVLKLWNLFDYFIEETSKNSKMK